MIEVNPSKPLLAKFAIVPGKGYSVHITDFESLWAEVVGSESELLSILKVKLSLEITSYW